jgi:hypothetical protein
MIGLKAKLIGAGVLVALLLGFVAHYYYIRTELTEARTELTEARSRVSTLEGAIAAERASMELRDDIVAGIDEEYKNDVIQMEETLAEHADWSDSPVPSAVLRGLLTGSQD